MQPSWHVSQCDLGIPKLDRLVVHKGNIFMSCGTCNMSSAFEVAKIKDSWDTELQEIRSKLVQGLTMLRLFSTIMRVIAHIVRRIVRLRRGN